MNSARARRHPKKIDDGCPIRARAPLPPILLRVPSSLRQILPQPVLQPHSLARHHPKKIDDGYPILSIHAMRQNYRSRHRRIRRRREMRHLAFRTTGREAIHRPFRHRAVRHPKLASIRREAVLLANRFERAIDCHRNRRPWQHRNAHHRAIYRRARHLVCP